MASPNHWYSVLSRKDSSRMSMGPRISSIRVLVEDSVLGDDSIAALHPSTLQLLSLAEGDVIRVRGKKRRETVLICTRSAHTKEGRVRITQLARNNLCLQVGSFVDMYQVFDIRNGKSVEILPFEDSLEGFDGNIYDFFLKPYFARARRPTHQGDTFVVRRDTRIARFKVIKTDPAEFCIVVPTTSVLVGTPPWEEIDGGEGHANIGYDDIGGSKEQLKQVLELVEPPLCHPQLSKAIGIPTPRPRGVLLYGPSGTGKSLIARAIENETCAFFRLINGPEIMSKPARQPESNLRDAFEEAKKNSPAIIFIDDIDSIAPKREKSSAAERRVVSQLITLMDSINTAHPDVIVMGATNRLNDIEPAFRHFGRFNYEVGVCVPDCNGRREILVIHTRNMRLSPDVDLEQIARDAEGYVGSDLKALCIEAGMEQIRQETDRISLHGNIVDTTTLDSLSVSMDNFRTALKRKYPTFLSSGPPLETSGPKFGPIDTSIGGKQNSYPVNIHFVNSRDSVARVSINSRNGIKTTIGT